MKRHLEQHIRNDLKEKIVLLSGPRQVGKTTLAKQLSKSHTYLNFDAAIDRRIIQSMEWNRDTEIVIFDELHKMKKWKSWIKGIYDSEGVTPALLVTGSARLDTYRKKGESLAGRFFYYRLHPLTVKEICQYIGETPENALDNIIRLGGFPEPYLKGNETYAKRFRRTHTDIIVREDILDLENVRDIKSIEILIDLLRSRVGSTTSYISLANDLQVSSHTVKHWLQILENMYIIFPVRPYHKNIARSLLKEAKYYLYDTGAVEGDLGAKLENAVACALIAELHYIEDTTGSKVDLHFLRDKDKHEVDFLPAIDGNPVCMIEVKSNDDNFSPSLLHFQSKLNKTRSYQIVFGLDHKKSKNEAKMLSAQKFLRDFDLLNFSNL